ncbi:MAG: hypothetical protein KC609_16010 [Myxococcales bacterium]|nr:hypothetical protein [Myxococcales bacterium]
MTWRLFFTTWLGAALVALSACGSGGSATDAQSNTDVTDDDGLAAYLGDATLLDSAPPRALSFRVISVVPRKPGSNNEACTADESDLGRVIVRLSVQTSHSTFRPGVLFQHSGSSLGSESCAWKEGEVWHKAGCEKLPTEALKTSQVLTQDLCLVDDGQPVCDAGAISSQALSFEVTTMVYKSKRDPSTPLGLVVLLDHSGSLSGSIEATTGGYREVDDGVSDSNLASDSDGRRLHALQGLLGRLSSEDRVVVVGFNSQAGLFTVCEESEATIPDFDERAKTCYSADKQGLVDPERSQKTLLSSELLTNARGRSPLWQAIEWAIGFHNQNSSGLSPQILVVSDGSDSCIGYEGLDDCSTTTFESLEGVVTSAIPIHFVQLASRVHPRADPKQRLLACLSGGEHVFVSKASAFQVDSTIGPLTAMADVFLGLWEARTAVGGNLPSLGTSLRLEGRFELSSLYFSSPPVFVFGANGDDDNRPYLTIY